MGARNSFPAMEGSRSHFTAALTCLYTCSTIEGNPIAKCEHFGIGGLLFGEASLNGEGHYVMRFLFLHARLNSNEGAT